MLSLGGKCMQPTTVCTVLATLCHTMVCAERVSKQLKAGHLFRFFLYKTTISKVTTDLFISTCTIECRSIALLDENTLLTIVHFTFYCRLRSSRNEKFVAWSILRADNDIGTLASSCGCITLLLPMPTRIALRAVSRSSYRTLSLKQDYKVRREKKAAHLPIHEATPSYWNSPNALGIIFLRIFSSRLHYSQ